MNGEVNGIKLVVGLDADFYKKIDKQIKFEPIYNSVLLKKN